MCCRISKEAERLESFITQSGKLRTKGTDSNKHVLMDDDLSLANFTDERWTHIELVTLEHRLLTMRQGLHSQQTVCLW